MEAHFLDDYVEGPQEFRAEPWYNPYGDCITYQIADEEVIADRVDEILTIYRSAVDDRPIGYQIKGVSAIIRQFGWDGLSVCSSDDGAELESVSIVAMLLAAYEGGPKTLRRRQAYATAFAESPHNPRMSRQDLVPA